MSTDVAREHVSWAEIIQYDYQCTRGCQVVSNPLSLNEVIHVQYTFSIVNKCQPTLWVWVWAYSGHIHIHTHQYLDQLHHTLQSDNHPHTVQSGTTKGAAVDLITLFTASLSVTHLSFKIKGGLPQPHFNVHASVLPTNDPLTWLNLMTTSWISPTTCSSTVAEWQTPTSYASCDMA